jgi:Na+/H+-dicarboxylate symporters
VVRSFFEGGALIVMKMVDIIMLGAPFFVFCLMAGLIGDMTGNDVGAMVDIFKGLGVYALAVLSGLLLVLVFLYPFYQKLFVGKISVIGFYRSIAPAQLLGFSSSSSAAALPVSMECAEKNLGVSPQVTSFVLPIGATINMDGSSLYLAVAAIFTAQLHMVDLSLGQMGIIMVTCLMGSIGAAAVPGAAVVMLMVVLSSVGLNPAWVAIILPVDRILDMARTVVNITSDLTVANIIQHRFVNQKADLPSGTE